MTVTDRTSARARHAPGVGEAPAAPPGPWRRTAAFYRVLTVAVFGTGLALGTGRPDLVVLAAPIVLAGALTLPGTLPLRWGGTAADPGSRAGIARGMVAAARLSVRIELSGVREAELVTVRVPESTRNPVGEMATLPGGSARGDSSDDLTVLQDVRVRGWGSSLISRPDLLAITADGLLRVGPGRAAEISQMVLPGIRVQDPLPLPPIIGGWAGSHVSRRPGQGSDLIDLRDYAPGDRMRSVHWRAYARRGKLYTRRTLSEAEAEIALCLDVRHVLGPRDISEPTGRLEQAVAGGRALLSRVGDEGRRRRLEERHERWDALEQSQWNSLDLTVQAVTAVAAAHLGGGDRVSVQTVDVYRRMLRHGSGKRQIDRVRYFLSGLVSRSVRLLDVEHWLLRPGAVVVLFSPLTDDAAVDAARAARARGHRVIVIDTLPLQGILAASELRDTRTLGLLSIARGLRVERVLAAGIPVLHWEEGSIDTQMAKALVGLRARR